MPLPTKNKPSGKKTTSRKGYIKKYMQITPEDYEGVDLIRYELNQVEESIALSIRAPKPNMKRFNEKKRKQKELLYLAKKKFGVDLMNQPNPAEKVSKSRLPELNTRDITIHSNQFGDEWAEKREKEEEDMKVRQMYQDEFNAEARSCKIDGLQEKEGKHRRRRAVESDKDYLGRLAYKIQAYNNDMKQAKEHLSEAKKMFEFVEDWNIPEQGTYIGIANKARKYWSEKLDDATILNAQAIRNLEDAAGEIGINYKKVMGYFLHWKVLLLMI